MKKKRISGHWVKREINIHYTSGWCKCIGRRKGEFFIHKGDTGWVLSNVPTGLLICIAPTMLTAKKIAHELMMHDWPWADPINNQAAFDQGLIREIIEKNDGMKPDKNILPDRPETIEYGNR